MEGVIFHSGTNKGQLFGGSCLRGNFSRVIARVKSPGGRVIILEKFHRGHICDGQLSKGKVFRGNCPGAKVWRQMSWRKFHGWQCLDWIPLLRSLHESTIFPLE